MHKCEKNKPACRRKDCKISFTLYTLTVCMYDTYMIYIRIQMILSFGHILCVVVVKLILFNDICINVIETFVEKKISKI